MWRYIMSIYDYYSTFNGYTKPIIKDQGRLETGLNRKKN